MHGPEPAGSAATAAEVDAAWHDTKLAQVLYHDWEARTYDDKWSISFDDRCIAYARDRFAAVARIPKPVVAAVTGTALGGGLELALCADVRVCGAGAKLGQPEIKLGVIPGAGGTQRLPRLVGPARAKELIFTGRFVDAEEALRIGLVDRVVAPDDVLSAALEWAAQFATGPALALRVAKEAIDHGLDGDLATGLEIERVQFAVLFATEDRSIGMASFVEHGPGRAQFVGR